MRVLLPLLLFISLAVAQDQNNRPTLTKADMAAAEKLMGLEFTDAERELMNPDLVDAIRALTGIRAAGLANEVPPSLVFNPLPQGFELSKDASPVYRKLKVQKPDSDAALAFMTVPELGALLRQGDVTSEQLTKLYLARLKTHNETLECVITLLEDSALKKARAMDAELKAGKDRGPLHGIPYGIKDLFALEGVRTTWGAKPYENQTIDTTATVIKKLDDAGAVLLAKLTLGALAWGDVWYGGMTRNPWNTEQGSSGSSAGSASATSAALVGFSIGTETWGSIVSPSTRCGTTGLRPTFGAVSRHGAMALSWSMDKIGPITRSVDGAAMVYDAIRGHDPLDNHSLPSTFAYRPQETDLSKLRIGYLKEAFEGNYPGKDNDQAFLDKLKELGAELIPIELPETPWNALSIILSAEAAAAFDELTRTNQDDQLVRQVRRAWPNSFRASRHIPAVEYINANRIRTQIIEEMADLMKTVDVYITPSFGGGNLLLTNLTGHPCVVMPNGFRGENPKVPTSITIMGDLFDEATLMAVASAWQNATDFHKQYPPEYFK